MATFGITLDSDFGSAHALRKWNLYDVRRDNKPFGFLDLQIPSMQCRFFHVVSSVFPFSVVDSSVDNFHLVF